jgi:hypothetical protein
MIKINPISGYITQGNTSKYTYEISNNVTAQKCKCGLCSSTINAFPDGKEIAMHVTLSGAYWHICIPGEKIKRVFNCPKDFSFVNKSA